jgi:hypothetical protein
MTCQAQDLVVNGYTYFAPSVYPTPPIVVYDPAFVVPTRTVILPRATYVAPDPVLYAEPAFVSHTVVPYNPVWNYGPVVGPTAYASDASIVMVWNTNIKPLCRGDTPAQCQG